jgi:gluconolactonase
MKTLLLIMCAAAGALVFSGLPSGLADPEEKLVKIADGFSFTEGPVYDGQGNWYFTDTGTKTIWKINAQGTKSTFRTDCNGANGLAIDDQGRLIACESNCISAYTTTDGTRTSLYTVTPDGAKMPNDLSIVPGKGLFFTCPEWNANCGDVYYLPLSGQAVKILSNVQGYPNGIEYNSRTRKLYVALTRLNKIMEYPVSDDMRPGTGRVFCELTSPDGFALDEKGYLWVACHTTGTIAVVDTNGTLAGSCTVEGQPSIQNCAFGGTDGRTLFIAARTAVYRLTVKVKGWSVPTVIPVPRSAPALRRNHKPGQPSNRSWLLDGTNQSAKVHDGSMHLRIVP